MQKCMHAHLLLVEARICGHVPLLTQEVGVVCD